MSSGIVVFDFSTWALRYPEFSSLNPSLVQLYFNEAQLYVDNSPCSIIRDLNQRAVFLNMVTAHITALNAAINGIPSSPLVGRIDSGTEGSVSVSTKLEVPAGCPQWFAQSKYGIAFWVASSSYRTMHYIPSCISAANPYGMNTIVQR